MDVERIRRDFPILQRSIGNHPLCYLDSANTSQKPWQVIEAVNNHYEHHNANVARAMHVLGSEATQAFEDSRSKIAQLVGAKKSEEIIFTKNASEALNLLANSLGSTLKPGDEIVISIMEHHSNLVPWQLVCQRTGAKLRWFDITDEGLLDLAKAEQECLINERTKVVSLTHTSNVLGTINPIADITKKAHQVGAIMIMDGAQAVPHHKIDVTDLGIDFMAFTGHKMCGPTGIGVLWGRYELLEKMPPFLGGGEMIEIVEMDHSTYASPPHKFEAGTQPIAQAIGLSVAIDYLNNIGFDAICEYESQLTSYALDKLTSIEGLKLFGPKNSAQRGCLFSFDLTGIHSHDVMQILDSRGIATRGGHHCARPLHKRLGYQSSTRASAYFYNTESEIDALVDALVYTRDFFNGRFSTR